MKAPDLAHAYVALDRFFFFRLQEFSEFKNLCARIEQHLKENEGLTDYRRLCDAGAEGDELLWLSAGCKGLPGLNRTIQVFGWPAPQLSKGLAAIEKAANVIEKMQHHPFGLLARHTKFVSARALDKDLRSYLALARAAQSDFGHGSEWFLNIAKARLVIHVIRRTNGDPKDKEVSGLGPFPTAFAPRGWWRQTELHAYGRRRDSTPSVWT